MGKLLFTLPLVASGDYDLIYAADGAIKTFHRDRGAIDDILIAALRNDVMELIKLSRLVPSWHHCITVVCMFDEHTCTLYCMYMQYVCISLFVVVCSSLFNNWWLVAHLSNILNHRGLLVASKLE